MTSICKKSHSINLRIFLYLIKYIFRKRCSEYIYIYKERERDEGYKMKILNLPFEGFAEYI